MTRRTLSWLGIWTLSTLAVFAQGPQFCAEIDVLTDPGKPPVSGPISARFVLDLYFEVNLSGEVTGEHILELKLRTPRGHEYQTLTVPITTDGGERGAERKVSNYPRPLRVQVLESEGRDSEGYRTQLSLPVAGTPIVSNALYGNWQIDVYLDGTLMACDYLNGFQLQP